MQRTLGYLVYHVSDYYEEINAQAKIVKELWGCAFLSDRHCISGCR